MRASIQGALVNSIVGLTVGAPNLPMANDTRFHGAKITCSHNGNLKSFEDKGCSTTTTALTEMASGGRRGGATDWPRARDSAKARGD
eukprot:5809717-Pyramimonas_sp.AAC.1